MARPAVDEGEPKPTLLLVANFAPDVGFAWWLVAHFWIELSAIAAERGLRPIIAYPAEGPIPSVIRDAGIEVVYLAFPGTTPGEIRSSLSFARRRRVKAIYFTDRAYASWLYGVLRLMGVRLIVNHDHTPGDRPAVKGIKGLLKSVRMRVGFATADLQVCVAPIIRDRAIRTARIPEKRAVVVQNGIEPLDCAGTEAYTSRTFGLPGDARICVTVGRAHPYKRIDFVIEVARRCVHELGLSQLYFIHCGDGPDLPRLRQMVKDARLGSRFLLAGRRSDVHQILCSADYALHAAAGEAFSLAIVEYMSARLAVLVPDVPTVRQAIRHRQNGLVYRDGDAGEAAAYLQELYGDSDTASQLGEAAAEAVRTEFSMQRMNEDFRRILGGALDALR